ncbi:MAG: phage baseplate assembly protein V [Phenylobacterium sp.]|nr:phage baseplate assembly protein V [Phenylobacterium sp.]
MREAAALARRISELERRLANVIREGVVEEIDPARQRVRLRLSGVGADAFLSPWVPYAQHAGALKLHTPPSVGQQMTLHSPAGDLRRGQAQPYTWSQAEPAPSGDGDVHVLTFGGVRIEVRADGLRIALGESVISVAPDRVRIEATEIVTEGTTRLDGGARPAVFQGSTDSGGDVNAEGAARVFV